MENNYSCMRCGYDRRYEDDRRSLDNIMPSGHDRRFRKVERRTPKERRRDWVRHTRWGSVGPEFKIYG